MSLISLFKRLSLITPPVPAEERAQLSVTQKAVQRHLSSALRLDAERIARQAGVSPDLHPADFIFWHIVDSHTQGNTHAALHEYFEGGKTSAATIRSAYLKLKNDKPLKILDFASGYCRISRHLPSAFPDSEIYTSDIHQEANDFARALGFQPISSTWHPSDYKPEQKFDLIIAISFFTHMPKRTWQVWLETLGSVLTDHGIILFTTHGVPAMAPMGLIESDIGADGFAHHPHTEQIDLDIDEYGSTTTLYAYVNAAIEQSNLELISFREAGFGYQDLYLARKSVDYTTDSSKAQSIHNLE